MEVVKVLEKHKEYLSMRFNDNILNGIREVIYSGLDIKFLDTALDVIFLFACSARIDEDNYRDFCAVINFFLDRDICGKNYYGELDTSKVLDDIRNNEDGTKVYVFRLNIAKINEKISDEQTFVIPLAFNFVQVDGENDLTWLYITLPVVAVVLAGGIVALI